MIQTLIRLFKLKTRIHLGYYVLGLLTLMIIFLSYLTFAKLTDNFKQFIAVNQQSSIDFVISQNITDMQRQSLIYIFQGHSAAADKVNMLYGQLIQQIDHHVLESNPKAKAIITQTRQHLSRYFDVFQHVVPLREQQLVLVDIKFQQHADSLEKLIQQLIQSTAIKNEVLHLNLTLIMNDVLRVQKNALLYFSSLDASYIKQADKNFLAAKQRIALLSSFDLTLAQQKITGDALQELADYHGVLLQAVQRTRGYLFLVNVVMSAEAYEILYHTKQLTELLTEQLVIIEHEVDAQFHDAINIVLWIGLVFFMLIILLSIIIGNSISQPIERLTRTFKALAHGDSKSEIVAYPVDDEIGELTHAAQVFRKKNLQTEQLLQHSNQLTIELKDNQAELQRSNDEMEQFVYTVSHDLKSPLVTSMGFIGIIKKLAQQGKFELACEKLDKVVHANTRMGQLINDLLDLSRIGRIDTEQVELDLHALMIKFKKMQQERQLKKSFSLDLVSTLPVIYANESRILELIENLFSNALKYAVADGMVKIEMGSKETEDAFFVFFKDHGPGIETAYFEKVFNLFYRLGTEQEGTGVGLTVAKKIMESHYGLIWVESKLQQGATFWLKFPKSSGVE